MKVLLSIKPEFADKIFNGTKKYEYRRSIFKKKEVKTVVVYASSPIQKIIGEFEEKIEDGKHILSLKDMPGEIVIDDKSGELTLEDIPAPIPSQTLPAGTEVEFKNNRLKLKFSLKTNIKFN